MKRILYFFLSPTLGSKKFYKFYEILKNISLVGLNYRNTDITKNGELFFIKYAHQHYQKSDKRVVLFDVGANIGNYSKQLGQVFTENRVIYAFEPFSKVYEELKVLESEIQAFKPIQLGFGEKKEKVTFLSSTDYSEVGGLYNKDFSDYNFSLNVSEELEFDSIDNFCSRENIDRIHFLKIDTEGHDFFVLKGAQTMLANNKIDFIQFEYGAANYLSKTYLYDFFQLLSPHYRIYRAFRNGLVEIARYNTDIEMHVLSNYVAINKSLNVTSA